MFRYGLAVLLVAGCARSDYRPRPMAPPSGTPFRSAGGAVAGPAPSSESDWDVSAPPGQGRSVQIDTTEGTWMSVDVSPDGATVVFDLLGDLYTVPIAGGEATPLASGIAWDMQPRYSPDGRWIAFTSDRGGGNNLWVMRSDGTDPRAVSSEKFRLVNSPAWSPDGSLVAGRKHFTSQRSLGAGEIWIYHRAGGGGVQGTKKLNDQKDVGEPAFSPDGDYLYFSQDVTPGERFEYNKNPHAGIYAIQRLDRRDGRIERVTGGPGGAIRPTPSPDGASLAFIRRQGLATTLVLHDLASGAERQLWDGLDRDLQETWAIHGVYPGMSWTPDGREIVVWAGGKLWRVAAADGAVREIPFRVQDQREVREALRYPVEVHPERFDVRMLRWSTVSPDGSRVVYQALGQLYVRELPEGLPRRLTTDSGRFELFPAFSRDGRQIVFATWSDDELGSVRAVSAGGGASRAVVDAPGHYLEPAFSPDGSTIVVRRGRGGYLRSPLWSKETGLFAVPAAGGELRRLTRSGTQPHFGADGGRVYYVETTRAQGARKVVLRSIGLDGLEPRDHATSRNATRLRVSPDGRWLAFQELFNAYVTPLVPVGRVVELGAESKAMPVARVSRDAGDYLHWGGPERLYWSVGPELFRRDLTEAFAFLEGAPDPLPAPAASGRNIGFSVPSARPTHTIALVGGRLITMAGPGESGVVERGTIVVEGNRISAVGPSEQVEVPPGATVIDVTGRTILPGLIDVHWHGAQGTSGITPQRNWVNYAALSFGVTTIHDPSNDTGEIFAAAELARAGGILAPRIFSTGTILYGADAPYKAEIDSLEQAQSHLRRMRAVGAISVKSYGQPRRDQRQQIIAAARELEMMVVPEGAAMFHHDMTMIVDGHTGVEHALPQARVYRDVAQLWAATAVGYTPTLLVGYGGLGAENYWYQESDVFAHERLRRFVPPFAVEPKARRRVTASAGDWNHIVLAEHCKLLLDAGVRVQLGAHGQREGLGVHWELWSFVQGGMSPLEALHAATLAGAAYLGLDRDLGSLEVGKLADLIVIDGNPLEEIRSSERVTHTMLNGRLFDASTMVEVGAEPTAAAPLFWQQ